MKTRSKLVGEILGEVDSDHGAIVQEHFLRVNGFYRLKAVVTDRTTGSSHNVDTHYDAESGVTRMLGFTRSHPRGAARIARHQDSYVASYRYGYLLGGSVGENGVSYIKEILDDASRWTTENVPDHEELVKLNFIEYGSGGSRLHKEVYLDISRSLLMIRRREERLLSRRSSDAPERWIRSVLEVLEAAPHPHVDVWYPTKIRYYSTTSRRPDMATVYDLEVSEIAFGTVSLDDLVVSFPQGAIVNDMLSGRTYTEGAVSTAQHPVMTKAEGGSWRRRLWVIANVFLLLAVLGVWLATTRSRCRSRAARSGGGRNGTTP